MARGRIVRHIQFKIGTARRPENHHDVPGAAFLERGTLDDILQDLFGDLGSGMQDP
jgi:hypothetical protein